MRNTKALRMRRVRKRSLKFKVQRGWTWALTKEDKGYKDFKVFGKPMIVASRPLGTWNLKLGTKKARLLLLVGEVTIETQCSIT